MYLSEIKRQYVGQKLSLLIRCVVLALCVYSTSAQSVSSQSFNIPAPQSRAMSSESTAVDNAVILMYHNVSDTTSPSTSVTPATFKKHMQYLQDNQFTVWSLSRTLTYLTAGKPLPPKTVVLTFDDAYNSVYSEVFPLLKEKGWPFTVFVTTQYIDEAYANFMSWKQLREIQKFGGEIGNHSRSHAHLIRTLSSETNEQWRLRIMNEVTQAQSILQQQIGTPIRVFAYPYGEYSKDVKSILRELGYFALGQQSGVASSVSDFQAIPRFPFAIGYDELSEFALKISTKALPVTVLSPSDGVLNKNSQIPELKLRLNAGDYKKINLACYASGQGRIQLEWLDKDMGMVKVRANESLKPGRTKYNCTAPSKTDNNVHYWFSFLWMKPEADGSWYRE